MGKKINNEAFIKALTKCLNSFIDSSNAIKEHFLKSLSKELKAQIVYTNSANKIYSELKELENDEKESVTLDEYISWTNLHNVYKNVDSCKFLTKLIPGNIIVSMLSSFDYYVFCLVHNMLEHDIKLFSNLDIKISYKDISSLNSIEEIKEYNLSSFIENLFLGSHDELFTLMETKLSINNLKKMEKYKDFIFIAELRNIIVHHDSKISLKFKSNMSKYNIKLKNYDVFDKDGYIDFSVERILWIIDVCRFIAIQIFLLIAQRYSRRNEKLKCRYINDVNNICVEMIRNNNVELAQDIFNLMLSKERTKNELFLLLINKALCLKTAGKMDEMKEFIASIEWGNAENDYLLAKYILLNDYDSALNYMDKVDLFNWQCGYQDWPLCIQFVKNAKFKEKYETIYGCKFERKVTKGKLSEKEIVDMYESYKSST